MKVGIVIFPGSNCDKDAYRFMGELGFETEWLWHNNPSTNGVDLVFLPGGFSYGDYLRSGAIARFSPVMESVIDHALADKPVIGICNGFQILVESGLLPGALRRNQGGLFRCKTVALRKEESCGGPWSGPPAGTILQIPIAHMDGNWYANETQYESVQENNQVAYRYLENPNGSLGDVAGLLNTSGNVLGMMPHPERAGRALLGSEDGREVFASILHTTART
ncbi:phosphoribosylformylglycinamidine synthase subunit PurQ [bacterium]|nr:phosphoribosylformylglycinamidine synthase subunit PurQ [bacterium]